MASLQMAVSQQLFLSSVDRMTSFKIALHISPNTVLSIDGQHLMVKLEHEGRAYLIDNLYCKG